MKYQFDWGDGASDWTEDYYDSGESVSMSHRWNNVGAYIVRTRAKDASSHYSDWSLLKFTVPNANEIAYFIFEINGYNIKP